MGLGPQKSAKYVFSYHIILADDSLQGSHTREKKITFVDKISKAIAPSNKEDGILVLEDFPQSEFEMPKMFVSFSGQHSCLHSIIRTSKAVKIKILITDIYSSRIRQLVRELSTQIFSGGNSFPQAGLFHLGLLIGPWIIDFNNSGLINPRPVSSRSILLACDLIELASEAELKETFRVISETICEWNTTKNYKNYGGNSTTVT